MKIGGGRELNDFRRLESLNPYAFFEQLDDSYNQLDASLGLKGNVGNGFWFDAFTGYRMVTDDLCFNNVIWNLFNVAKPYAETDDTRHFYIGSNLKYNYRGIADLSLKGTYYSWKNSEAACPAVSFQGRLPPQTGRAPLNVRRERCRALIPWKSKVLQDFTAKPLQVPIFLNGALVYRQPALPEIRKYCAEQVETLWDEVKRFDNPHNYYVDLSKKLWDIKQELLRASR